MVEKTDRLSQNVGGLYYVDSSCVDCDLCRNTAPDFFRRDEETGFSYVYRQPVAVEEIALAEEAKQGCPTESIGNDGVTETAVDFLKSQIENQKFPVHPRSSIFDSSCPLPLPYAILIPSLASGLK